MSSRSSSLADEVPVGLRHHVGLAHRPAALRDDRPDLDAARQHDADRAGVGDLVVEDQTVAARLHGGGGQPADDLQLRQILVHPVEEGVGGERERVGQQQHGAVGVVGPADQRRAVGGGDDLEADGRQQRRRKPGGEEGEGGGVLHLAASADDRPGGGAEQDGGVEEAPDRAGDVLDGADVVRRREGDHQIGPLVAQRFQHLADGFADGLAGDRMLREPEGVGRHCVTPASPTVLRLPLAAGPCPPGIPPLCRGAPTPRRDIARIY
jgi:hypothetical protein